MLIRYFKGAGSSLFISILIYLLTVPIYKEYLTFQITMIALYVYVSCILGITVYSILVKYKKETNYIFCFLLYILLGGLASIAYWPLFFIFIVGSLVFYLVQLVQKNKFPIVLSISGPIFLIIILILN